MRNLHSGGLVRERNFVQKCIHKREDSFVFFIKIDDFRIEQKLINFLFSKPPLIIFLNFTVSGNIPAADFIAQSGFSSSAPHRTTRSSQASPSHLQARATLFERTNGTRTEQTRNGVGSTSLSTTHQHTGTTERTTPSHLNGANPSLYGAEYYRRKE